jgi:hypothetical protein
MRGGGGMSPKVYLHNGSPTAAVKDMTPEEAWNGRKVDLSHLHGFGYCAFRHAPERKRKKWGPKCRELVHVGYSEESKVYRLIDSVTTKICKARGVVFFEDRNVESNTLEEEQEKQT